MTPKANTKLVINSTSECGKNDETTLCPEVPFSKDPRRVETSTLTCFTSQWTGLYTTRFLILEVIFERTVRP